MADTKVPRADCQTLQRCGFSAVTTTVKAMGTVNMPGWNPLIQTSKELKAYLEACALRKEVHNAQIWMADLIRISAKFADALITSPSAIFSLVPPFYPLNSAIHKA
ncbi:hypothetical protein BU26DRAFT_268862 [Trematosphaeria pertusa]|uniref:Uncharacterized protein n=1 Tax=Trematosphaeria pertusa TaxID=390896 RepID=A0A6A6IKG8_9PLEO|nr:uncharacterized protein BU26DRAFT_268862 [Trematosphaeria pertusa]KAF2250699.1 hypothetical protein BU26DRAFT_268862 [Trematosphaeria pertusa]